MEIKVTDTKAKRPKVGSGCLTVFGAIFFLAGVGIFLFGLKSVYHSMQAADWQPVQAVIETVELVESRDDDSITYSVTGNFSYQYQGQTYRSSQLNFYSGSDNVGSYQQDFYRRLVNAKRQQQPVTAYVNPEAPQEAVIDRDIRWGMLGFQSIFLLVFGGIGLGIMLWGRIAKKLSAKQQRLQELYPDEPWNWREEWQTNRFKATSSKGFKGILAFALLWNLIAIPSSVMAMIEYFSTFKHELLIVLIFPAVGIGLIAGTVVAFIRHKRYGQSELILEQTPIAIGGSTKGEIWVPNDDGAAVEGGNGEAILTLSCRRVITRGSGKNRSTTTKVVWQDDRRITPRAMGGNHSNFEFAFQVPEGLPASDNSNPNNRVEWVLKLHRKQPGIDLKLEFELPAFVVAHRVAFEPGETDLFGGSTESTASSAANLDGWQNLGLQQSVNSHGNRYYFPAFRNPSIGITILVLGLIFAGVGIGVGYADAPILFPIVFGGFGILMLVFALRVLTFKSEVTVGSGQLYVASGHLTLGSPQLVRREQIASIQAQSNMSSGDKKIYHVVAHLNDGKKLVLARNLLIKNDVDAFINKVKQELGMA